MLSRIARMVLGLVALGALVYMGALDLTVVAKALSHPGLLAVATILLLLTMPLAAFRWWLLLRSLDFPVGFQWSLKTTFTSQFFHTFLPGAYGGDLVRATLAYRAIGRGLSHISFSIVVDRLSGLVALLVLALGMLPFLPPQFRTSAYPFLAAGTIALIGGTTFCLLFGAWIAKAVSLLPAPLGPRFAHVVLEILRAVRAYFDRWVILLAVFLLSILQFILVLFCLALLGRAMGFDALALSGYMIAGSWSVVANALPVTPGGLGVGEAAFANIANLLETSKSGASYASAFLAMRVLTVIIALLGFLPYVTQRSTMSQMRDKH